MVKEMDDYKSRIDDKRFEKFDRLIANNENDKKFAVTVVIGIIVSLSLLIGSALLTGEQSINPQYDYGLNISYSPAASSYFIEYTNPNETAKSLSVNIGILMSGTDYTTVYTKDVSTFPVNISYRPSNPGFSHKVAVNIVKDTGNYTYFYTNMPSDDDQLYKGLYQYTDKVTGVIK